MKKTLIITQIPFFIVLTNSYGKEIKQLNHQKSSPKSTIINLLNLSNQYSWTDKADYNITQSLPVLVEATAGVKGVKIALGKNPPGGKKYLPAATNDNGNIEFEIKETGNYQFKIDYSKEMALEIEKRFGINRNSFEGFNIKVINSNNKKVISSNVTNENGEFEISNLNIGNYILTIFHELIEHRSSTIPNNSKSISGGFLANWGKYGWDGDCNQGGIFCRKWLRLPDLNTIRPEENSTSGESKITLEGNVITVTTIGTKGSIGDELLLTTNEKSLKPMPGELPQEMLKDILGNVGLKMPKGKVRINTNDQKVVINDTENRGKKLRIVEVYEKANLSIDGKTYTLQLITTSGRGAGSPKHAGF